MDERQVIERIVADPTPKYEKWLIRVTDDAIKDIYNNDLIANDTLTLRDFEKPTPDIIKKLIGLSREHRKQHYRLMQGKDYKDPAFKPEKATDEEWEAQQPVLAESLIGG